MMSASGMDIHKMLLGMVLDDAVTDKVTHKMVLNDMRREYKVMVVEKMTIQVKAMQSKESVNADTVPEKTARDGHPGVRGIDGCRRRRQVDQWRNLDTR